MAYLIHNAEFQPVASFVHIPRTGGTFVRRALGWLGFTTRMLGYAHAPLHNTEPGLFSFYFVRHPVTWYTSLFALRQRDGWPETDSFPYDQWVKADTLEQFVENCAQRWPGGRLWEVIQLATRDGERRISFVGRYRSLVNDLAVAVASFSRLSAEECLRELQRLPIVNDCPKVDVPPELAQRICDYEHLVIEEYYS